MMKKYLDYLLWASGWSIFYVLMDAAFKFTYEHFGWNYSETAFLFGFLLAVIGMTNRKE